MWMIDSEFRGQSLIRKMRSNSFISRRSDFSGLPVFSTMRYCSWIKYGSADDSIANGNFITCSKSDLQ